MMAVAIIMVGDGGKETKNNENWYHHYGVHVFWQCVIFNVDKKATESGAQGM